MSSIIGYISNETVEQHNSQDDCWMIVGNNVLDVTHFLYLHPGGMDYLLPYLGKDCTEMFIDSMHSKSSQQLIEKYRIGYIKNEKPDNIPLEYNYLYDTPKLHIEKNDLNLTRPASITSNLSLNTNNTLSDKDSNYSSISSTTKTTEVSNNLDTLDDSPHSLIDFTKPLLSEISKLNRDDYFKLIDCPYTTNKVLQIFPMEPFEMLSKTYWYIIPIFYTPIICFMFYFGAQLYPMPYINMIALFVLGFFTWGLVEYLFHRFLFHYLEEYLPDHYLFLCLHFLIHSVHHLLPMDPMRLVMPPALFCLFASPFLYITYFIIPIQFYLFLWSGVLTGYVLYDMIHYSTHHFSVVEFIPHLKEMKNYHMKHHYKFPLKGFGISYKFWDRVFNTLIE